MSNKTACVGCGTCTSAVTAAFDHGDPCPTCHLPAEAAVAVLIARGNHADEQLVARCIEAEKRAAAAERELSLLRHRLSAVRDALESDPRDMTP